MAIFGKLPKNQILNEIFWSQTNWDFWEGPWNISKKFVFSPFKKWHTLFLDHVSACGSPRLRAPKDGHCLIPSCFPGACYGAQIITHAQQLFAKWKRIQWYVQIEKSRLIFEDTWVLCTGHRSLLPLAKASTLFSAPSHYPSQSLLSLCFPPQGLPWWLRP